MPVSLFGAVGAAGGEEFFARLARKMIQTVAHGPLDPWFESSLDYHR